MKNSFAFINKLGYTTKNGLCFDINQSKNNVERLYITEAKSLNVNAVYFRRFFRKGEILPYHSEPTVCIFQKSTSFFNSIKHQELHAALWSAGRTEIYIIYTPTRVDIINARKPAKKNKNNVSIEGDDLVLESIIGEAIQEFNDTRYAAHLFGNGTFWEQHKFKSKIDSNQTPYIFLLDHLMKVRKKLSDKNLLTPACLDKLLIIAILVKFLEEIKDDEEQYTLQNIYKKYQINSFEDALLQNNGNLCLNILNELATEFNGKVFDTFTLDEKEEVSKANLTQIAKFLSADVDIDTNQIFIWKQYSFKHLPAEVISAIYENFIQAEAFREKGQQEKSIVYTPIHLVTLLINETMPLDKPELFKNNQFKVLDPACGSGVFLVMAYRRLLQWWAINHYNETGQIVYPNKKTAQQILEKNIFGIDIKATAILVSIFGLTISLLDKLTPKEVWSNLKFKNLKRKNIQKQDFFVWAQENQGEKFDLVIGNPPFNPPTGVSKKEVVAETHLQLFGKTSKEIPNNHLALKFLEGAFYFGKKVCMIIPSNVLLYSKSSTNSKYRTQLFTNHTVKKIFDFTHLRESLFTKKASKGLKLKKSGRIPVLALIAQKESTKYQSIEHIIVKREFFSEQRIRFEIDYYDQHTVKWHWAVDKTKQFIWKTNLLGGGRLFHLIYRLSLLRTLKEFIKEKEPFLKEKRGYEGGESLILNNQDRIININNDGTLKIKKNTTIKSSKLKDDFMYQPPFIVIDQVFGNNHLKASFVLAESKHLQNKRLFYNRDFIGISSDGDYKNDLEEIYNYVTNQLSEFHINCQLYIAATGGSNLIMTETDVNKEVILSIPYPKNKEYLKLNSTEKIIQHDILKYYRHLGKAISNKSFGEPLHQSISPKELDTFGVVYCETMNELYAKNGKSWQVGKIIETPMFIKYQFGFGKNGGLQKIKVEQKDETLIFPNIVYQKIIRYYNHENGYDSLYLIKPKNRRYWLPSIALKDADDTFMDLRKAGY